MIAYFVRLSQGGIAKVEDRVGTSEQEGLQAFALFVQNQLEKYKTEPFPESVVTVELFSIGPEVNDFKLRGGLKIFPDEGAG